MYNKSEWPDSKAHRGPRPKKSNRSASPTRFVATQGCPTNVLSADLGLTPSCLTPRKRRNPSAVTALQSWGRRMFANPHALPSEIPIYFQQKNKHKQSRGRSLREAHLPWRAARSTCSCRRGRARGWREIPGAGSPGDQVASAPRGGKARKGREGKGSEGQGPPGHRGLQRRWLAAARSAERGRRAPHL